MLMKYWLIKTEPEEWSWQQQVKSGNKGAEWNGVRNYQAAKNLKNMKINDKCFFYHTSKEKRIVGIVEIIKTAFTEMDAITLIILSPEPVKSEQSWLRCRFSRRFNCCRSNNPKLLLVELVGLVIS